MVTFSALPPGAVAALGPLLLDLRGPAAAAPFDALADLADALPDPLRGPDATPSLPTGASDVSRADAFTYGALATVPRIVAALGPLATGVVVGGEFFAIAARYDDPASGFGAVQLRSLLDDRSVFAVDGTDFRSLPDIVANLDLARPQVASPAFAAMVADARAAAVGEGREVVLTGASLGGALVQVAGYETAEAILAASFAGPADRVTVLTVDSMGGRDAAEGLNAGALDPAVLERMNAFNIRTLGDIVSRIGSDLGDTLTLQAVDAAGQPVALSAQEAHVNLQSLSIALSSDALFAAGTRGDPGEVGGLTLLANTIGPLLPEILADPVLAEALAAAFVRPGPPEPPFGGSLDPTGGSFNLDPNRDGVVDLRVLLGGAGDLLIA
jgi:hypothetical protein